MSPEEITLIEDFLTFLEAAHTKPADDPFWSQLDSFQAALVDVEDRPLKLAWHIQAWCDQFQITINPAAMRELRVNMIKKGKTIPKPAEGEEASKVYNKALISQSVQKAKDSKSA
ncbi:hypothetical protein K4A83_20370 [Spirulina subsalsa FACHB-351]|uniref:Replicative helicase inhibitor G39P N-terminal domain-containing protein n=1 Tax=Spirulina subsalsa FACHB-351 TaxID=234711 RepID=A0ABT3LAT2_9CYAN|nr:hypothetical protein [Spirulina subsalsa]MCW6038608.1 hypothetical protein [Spirulina subsalsa FACHB-351]